MLKAKRYEWIDCLKFIAVFAVIVDHSQSILNASESFVFSSLFAVPLFVFIGGVNSYSSAERHITEPWVNYTLRRVFGILIPYAIATAIYLFFESHTFNLKVWLESLINFSASGPFYFVLFYIQLILITRPLFSLLEETDKSKRRIILIIIECVVFFLLSVLFMRYTFMLPVHGAGQYLFGGTFLFVFFSGMLFCKLQKTHSYSKKKILVMSIFSFIALVGWFVLIVNVKFSIDEALVYFGRMNPPGITLIVYSFLIFLFAWSLNQLCEAYNLKVLLFIRNFFAKIGKYSLYIFLFHMLVLKILKNNAFVLRMENIWLKRIVFYFLMIAIPIVIGILIEKFITYFKKISAPRVSKE